ncbi:MAG: mechanosensitive ion channel, partial [Bdellovibrionales bacterium]|nr:mechanosensitive ion channel [Bdellovibrionales bacterium]
ISVFVGVAYGTDVPQVMEILKKSIEGLPFILEYPKVSVLFKEFGDSSLNFEARGWIRNVQKRPTYESEMMVAVSKALSENGIEIPFPQRDLHIVSSKIGNAAHTI